MSPQNPALCAVMARWSAVSLKQAYWATGSLGVEYAYGAGLLFVISTFFLGFALFRFAQEAHISLGEADEYR